MTRESVPHYVERFYAVLSVTQYADERDFGAVHVFSSRTGCLRIRFNAAMVKNTPYSAEHFSCRSECAANMPTSAISARFTFFRRAQDSLRMRCYARIDSKAFITFERYFLCPPPHNARP